MLSSRLLLLMNRRPNLFPHSEGNAASAVSNTGTSDAAQTLVGFDNSIQFPAGATLALLYRGYVQTAGVAYTLSAFVQMDDGSAPVVGLTSATGDLAMQIKNAVNTPSVVTQISGSLYRISTPFVSDGTTPNIGVLRYATQSGKAFRITGFQLNKGLTASQYQKTT